MKLPERCSEGIAAGAAKSTAQQATTPTREMMPTASATAPVEPSRVPSGSVDDGIQGTAAAHPLKDFLARERIPLVFFLAFILLWTVELYLVQARTLIPAQETGARFAFWAPKIRLLFDIVFTSMLAFGLGRRLLIAVSIGAFFCHLGLITHYHYFSRPLSALTLVNNWYEGQVLSQFALDLFPKLGLLLLALALAGKLALLLAGSWPRFSRRVSWGAAGLFFAGYVALFLITNHPKIDPLDKIRTTRGVGRLGVSRGYLGPWLAELYYLQDNAIIQEALDRRKKPSDVLSPSEASIPIHRRLIIIQAESLDYNVLGYEANGQEVTPFLNRLRDRAMFYRVRPYHTIGSSDADFVTLAGVRPSPHVVTYKIPGYPWHNASPHPLPIFLQQFGYKTYGFHGSSGNFYSRRSAWEQMGFAEFYFKEELVSKKGLPTDRWGARDRDVLRLSQQMLKDEAGKICHFVITLTTHTPYTELGRLDQKIFPEARTRGQNFLNNMHYLDECLRDYIVPLTDATVMLYADHPTEVDVADGDFRPAREDGKEFIPCFIYDTDQNLADRQLTRGKPITSDGTLTLLDMITYLRHQIEKSSGDSTSAAKD